VSFNQLSGSLPDLPANMTYLKVNGNQLSGTIPESLAYTSIAAYSAGNTQNLYLCGGHNTLTVPNSTVDGFIRAAAPQWRGSCTVSAAKTIGVYRSNTFYLRTQNTTGFANITVPYGSSPSDYPVVGDWNGDGIDTVGIYDRSNGLFQLRDSNTAGFADYGLVLGIAGDQPIAGRWTNDMTHTGVGVFRPSNGLIYLKKDLSTGFADFTMVLGIPGDIGVAGDWDGNELDSPGVYRPTSSTFFLSNKVLNGSVFGDYSLVLGFTGDVPIMGDWTSQGRAGVGVFRPSNGQIYLKNALRTGYANVGMTFGIANDVPVAGHWSSASGAPDAANLIVSAASAPIATAAPAPRIEHPSAPGYDG